MHRTIVNNEEQRMQGYTLYYETAERSERRDNLPGSHKGHEGRQEGHKAFFTGFSVPLSVAQVPFKRILNTEQGI